MNTDEAEKLLRALKPGEDPEEALQALRAHGCSKIESMIALRKSGRCSLAEAKVIVHGSKSWEDVAARDEAFHDALVAEVEKLTRAPSDESDAT